MEEFPEELRTPPVALVALVGVPDVHSTISLYLHTEQPPINTLALPDFSKVSMLGGKERKSVDARLPPPVGILKADWLLKHRTRTPAVLAALFDREHIYGDPAQWQHVCSALDNIKNVIRGRNIKLLVMIIQPTLNQGEINEDRLTAFRKRAEVDAKSCLTFITQDPNEHKRSLARLGSILGELATTYYREEGRRVKLRVEKKTYSSMELSVRYNFKVAVYAEFRRDWVAALKSYETAYSLLQEVVTTPMELQPVQRIVELKAVAEQLHFKVSTLLLHSGKEAEAVKWFRQHMAWYKRLVGPSEGAFLHWAWVCKQYLVFAELLVNSFATAGPAAALSTSLPGPPVTDRELHPSYYYQVAAAYMTQRKRSFESVIATFEAFEEANAVDVLAGSQDDVGAPLYVGQAPRLLRRGNSPDTQIPTAGEFMRHAVAVEKTFSHSLAAIELLTKAHEQYKLLQASRMIYHIGGEMAREYFNARDYKNAMQLFDSVASMYRKEAWVALLGATLGYLQECARQLGLLKEYVEYALELASLPVPKSLEGADQRIVSGPQVGPAGPLTDSQRVRVLKDVIGLLRGATSVLPARDGEKGLAVNSTQPVMIEIDLVSSLRAVLSACAAFQESTVQPGKTTQFTLCLLTHLPLRVELNRLEVHFNQRECNFFLSSSSSPGSGGTVDNEIHVRDSRGVEEAYNLALEPDKWKRFVVSISPCQSGKLECLSVIAHIGPHATIKCQVESAASREEVPLWVYEPGVDLLPVKDSTLSFFGQKVILVEEPEPLADIEFKFASGPAMVLEDFPVHVCIRSTGHAIESGELEVYLAAIPASLSGSTGVSGVSADSAMDGTRNAVPAELLVTHSHDAHLSNGPSFDAAAARLDTFSGSVVVPPIGPNESWSAVFFVRSLEVRNLSFNASLQYQAPPSAGGTRRQSHLKLTKSVQISCEDPLSISYRYVAGFRRDALLHRGLQQNSNDALPLKETSILVVTAKSTSSFPVRLLSVHAEEQDCTSCLIRRSGPSNQGCTLPGEGPAEDAMQMSLSTQSVSLPGVVLSHGEMFSQLFWVRPLVVSPVLQPGKIVVTWERDNSGRGTNEGTNPFGFVKPVSKPVQKSVQLAPLLVESPPLIVDFDCPPYALLGVPFILSLKVQNQTAALQEISFSVTDAQSFIFSGAHTDSFSVLPFSTYVLSYRFVPIASGMQQLPHVQLTSSRFSARFQSSPLGTQLFIFPSAPTDPVKSGSS